MSRPITTACAARMSPMTMLNQRRMRKRPSRSGAAVRCVHGYGSLSGWVLGRGCTQRHKRTLAPGGRTAQYASKMRCAAGRAPGRAGDPAARRPVAALHEPGDGLHHRPAERLGRHERERRADDRQAAPLVVGPERERGEGLAAELGRREPVAREAEAGVQVARAARCRRTARRRGVRSMGPLQAASKRTPSSCGKSQVRPGGDLGEVQRRARARRLTRHSPPMRPP